MLKIERVRQKKRIKGRHDCGSGSQWWNVRSTQATTAGFKDRGKGSWSREYGDPLEAAKGKEVDYPLETPEENTALPTPQFSLRDTYFGHLTYTIIR